jgi:hypothetical protein
MSQKRCSAELILSRLAKEVYELVSGESVFDIGFC